MRILMISDTYFPRISGVATSIRSFRQGLELLGHEVDLLIPDYGSCTSEEYGIYRIPARNIPFFPEERLMQPRALLKIKTGLKARHYDILHIQTPFVAHYLGNHLARSLKLPVISSYHTYFEAYLGHYYRKIPGPLRKAMARIPSRQQCAAINGLIVPSQAMAEVLWDYGIRTPTRVIPTGIRINHQTHNTSHRQDFRTRYNLDQNCPVLLYAGRMAPEKNIGLLLSMLKQLRQQFPDILLLLVGDGPARSNLENEVQSSQLAQNVRFLGYLDHVAELPQAYAAADLLVFASETETQGMVLLEALAAGLPIVAVPAMGAADVLRSSLGTRSAPAEANTFARTCAELLADENLRQQLSDEARKLAQDWAESAMVAKLAEFYRETINENRTKQKL
ncbi:MULTISPECIES: glycosyltransferase [Acidithiobacillus]|jgi:glycosyltransferase involved in cell wall biosynthesis|uniref:glycosyltransferase n=1 Tax=Acidithiobacillus TaxID=119977 RepID=UPI0009DAF7C1|nr:MULTISPECIES: glycosyltransferase [Acidithiobacillus]MBU2742995.1 glycosyltransferase family 4 protein [Acidithiobacillus albertensis]MBU2837174.1 glycosyltransferase family 4 protein [Acidithiobacillus thiooxidans]MDA8177732.1 glycosyltransferase [Acidithiobacillus sp.]